MTKVLTPSSDHNANKLAVWAVLSPIAARHNWVYMRALGKGVGIKDGFGQVAHKAIELLDNGKSVEVFVNLEHIGQPTLYVGYREAQ